MIDRPARKELARWIRRLACGACSIDEFERSTEGLLTAPETFNPDTDRGLNAVWCEIILLCDDTRSGHFRGAHRLPRETRRGLARCVLFLHSDQEYEWPEPAAVLPLLLHLVAMFDAVATLVTMIIGAMRRRDDELEGDEGAWPFLTFRDLENAAARPRLLAGAA
jgi:hypothetical protein